MRVAVDAAPLLAPRTGVGVFTGELLTHLAERDDLHITAYAVSWRGRNRLADVVPPRTAVARRPMAARPLHRLWTRRDRPRVDHWIGDHDVVWGTNFVVPPTGAGALVTVHDLTPVRFPELTTAHTRTYPDLIRRAIGRGAVVHTVSEYVRREVIDTFGVAAGRVHAIPNGVRPTPPPAAGAVREVTSRLVGGRPYILALGTVEPRKDLPTLVAAFDRLAGDHPDLGLVIAGPDGWGADALSAALDRAAAHNRVIRLGWVEEHDRPALLAGATVFAYPSLYEGFGMPPLEAMSLGVPVVATRAGSLPEVCGDSADLVPVGDPDALAQALDRAVADDGHRAGLVDRGRRNAARYSWADSADAMADLLHRTAARDDAA